MQWSDTVYYWGSLKHGYLPIYLHVALRFLHKEGSNSHLPQDDNAFCHQITP